MKNLFGGSLREEGDEWLSVSDLMTGLMVIFLFIAIVFIRPLAEQNLRIREIARTWQENETDIYEALLSEFTEDLPRWNAEIERDTLIVRFTSPEVLFEIGKATLRPRFSAILDDFFPRYVKVLKEFRVSLDEVRIEGHTSSDWRPGSSADEAYFGNMELSQARTRAVLRYVLGLGEVFDDRDWLQALLTANGLSSSRLVLTGDGQENPQRSRRVEFRIRTTAREGIVRIVEAAQ